MTQFIQNCVDALSVGSTYALLALSLTLVFSVMNLINFAFGMMLVWAGYSAIVLQDHGIPFALVVPLCILFSIALSLVIGRVAFKPFIGAPPITLLITSFGVLLIIQYVAIVAFGEGPRILQTPAVLGDVQIDARIHPAAQEELAAEIEILVLPHRAQPARRVRSLRR